MLYADSTDDFIARVKNIEHRADRCLEHLALRGTPTYIACWTVLGATIHMIEENHQCFGPDAPEFKAAMLNLSRHAPILIRSLGENGMESAPTDWVPCWQSPIGGAAFRDLRIIQHYDAFLLSYPMWYRNRLSAELLSDEVVRFRASRNSCERQVSAFQKGLRRKSGVHQAVSGVRIEPTEGILRRYERILDAARPGGWRGFHYEHSYELANRTFHQYIRRMNKIMRRSENLDLGDYTLGTFKQFYAALLTICAVHEYLCFLWGKRSGTYPIESAVLVKKRVEWIRLLSFHSGISPASSDQLVSDLTFSSKRLPNLHVFPFIALDEQRELLALVPHFILASSPEENILRTCSYLREGSHSLLSDDKAAVMTDELLKTLGRFRCNHAVRLPDGSTEIDLAAEDMQSSTVLIAELKWYRKPSTYRERLRVDADFEDGYVRQLATVQTYCKQNPEWLKQRNALAKSLTDYENVYYLLIGRDHWTWFDPRDNAAVVEYEQFRLAVNRHDTLNEAIQELLRYDWLPIEGEDFHVRFDRAVVEGVGLESEVYYGGPSS
jgi:hypothetical protein